MEYCYKYNRLGLWNRNKFVTSCNSSMGEEECSYSFCVTVFSYFNRKAPLQWDDSVVQIVLL